MLQQYEETDVLTVIQGKRFLLWIAFITRQTILRWMILNSSVKCLLKDHRKKIFEWKKIVRHNLSTQMIINRRRKNNLVLMYNCIHGRHHNIIQYAQDWALLGCRLNVCRWPWTPHFGDEKKNAWWTRLQWAIHTSLFFSQEGQIKMWVDFL